MIIILFLNFYDSCLKIVQTKSNIKVVISYIKCEISKIWCNIFTWIVCILWEFEVVLSRCLSLLPTTVFIKINYLAKIHGGLCYLGIHVCISHSISCLILLSTLLNIVYYDIYLFYIAYFSVY